MTAPVLVLAVGNPSRGDDALGPRFLERAAPVLAEEVAAGRLELLTDFQLQIEHALDLVGRTWVLFVDASVAAHPPFELGPPTETAPGVSTHRLSPGEVLAVHRRTVGPPPPAAVLAIRGTSFELGAPLSAGAEANLAAAVAAMVPVVRDACGR